MVAPVLASSATHINTNSPATFLHVVEYPADIEEGDTLITEIMADGDSAQGFRFVTPAGWTQGGNKLEDDPTRNGALYYKEADGTETGTFTILTTSSLSLEQPGTTACHAFRGAALIADNPPEFSNYATGTGAAGPDAPNLIVGAAKTYLVMAFEGHDRERTVIGYPSNMTTYQGSQAHSSGGGAGLGWAGEPIEADNFDPAFFTINAVDEWMAWTVFLHPDGSIVDITATPGGSPVESGHAGPGASWEAANAFNDSDTYDAANAWGSEVLNNDTPDQIDKPAFIGYDIGKGKQGRVTSIRLKQAGTVDESLIGADLIAFEQSDNGVAWVEHEKLSPSTIASQLHRLDKPSPSKRFHRLRALDNVPGPVGSKWGISEVEINGTVEAAVSGPIGAMRKALGGVLVPVLTPILYPRN